MWFLSICPLIARALRAASLATVALTATTSLLQAQRADPTARVAARPKIHAGTRVRVWTDGVGQVILMSSRPDFHEGTFLRWDGDSLTFELDEPVATVAEVGIGRMRTENTVPLWRVSRIQRQHIGTTPTRLKLGLALGAVAGTLVAVGSDECGNDSRCSTGQRLIGGTVVFGVVTAVTAIRRVWQEVELK